MHEKVVYKGMEAKSYIEGFLFMMANENKSTIERQKIKKAFDAHGFSKTGRELTSAISNFLRIGIIRRTFADRFTVEPEVVRAFANDYIKGNVRLWYCTKGQRTLKAAQERADLVTPTESLAATACTGVEVIRAILAAYEKPIAARDIPNLAKKHGYSVSKALFGYFRSKHKDFLARHDRRGIDGYTYTASKAFFENQVHRIDRLTATLPTMEQAIVGRFCAVLGVAETGKRYDGPIDLTRSAEKPRTDPAAATTAPAAGRAGEGAQVAGPANDSGQVDDLLTAAPGDGTDADVDAADVGAAILAYISRLKTKARRAPQVANDDNRDIKIENMAASIRGLTAEKANLESQVNKLKAILDDKQRRMDEMQLEINDLTLRYEKRCQAPRSTFKMREVAKIGELIKGQSRGH